MAVPVDPGVENPNIQQDLYMMLELYDDSNSLIAGRIPCLVEVSDGISRRIRDLGVTRRQADPSNSLGPSPPKIQEMAYASSWNFRDLKPLELNELFWPFQAQRNAEMLVAIEIDSMAEGLRSLDSSSIKSTGTTAFDSGLKDKIDSCSSVTVIWGKTNSDKEFSLDMFPASVSHFDDMVVIHLVDFRYFANSLSLRDFDISNPDYFQTQISASQVFGARGQVNSGRTIRYRISDGDVDSQSSDEYISCSLDPGCYSQDAQVGVIADNEVLGQLSMPACIPDFRRAAAGLDARNNLTNSTTSGYYSSAEYLSPSSYTIAQGYLGNRIIAKNSAWPNGTMIPVGTAGNSSLYRHKVLTDVFWCEDGLVTGVERSDSVISRGDQELSDDTRQVGYNFGIPQKKYKTCIRLPITSENAGGADIPYTTDSCDLDNALERLTGMMRWLTSFTNAVCNQSAPDHFSGGVVFLNIEEDASLSPTPFGDLTYMALKNECAYIKFGIWKGEADSMPIPGRNADGTAPVSGAENTTQTTDVDTLQKSPVITVLSAQCNLVPYAEDAFNYCIPVNFVLDFGACKDTGAFEYAIATADDTTSTPTCTLTKLINEPVGFGENVSETVPSSDWKIVIADPMFATVILNGRILAKRVQLNATSTRTASWIAIEQEC